MKRFFYDTAVFLYAVGAEHPLRSPCRRLVDLAADGRLDGEASVELIQELVHVRARRTGDRSEAARTGRDVAAICRLHDLTELDLQRALDLFQTVPGLHLRDAIHAATALGHGVSRIVSPDRAFDRIPGLTRIDPAAAEDELLGD